MVRRAELGVHNIMTYEPSWARSFCFGLVLAPTDPLESEHDDHDHDHERAPPPRDTDRGCGRPAGRPNRTFINYLTERWQVLVGDDDDQSESERRGSSVLREVSDASDQRGWCCRQSSASRVPYLGSDGGSSGGGVLVY
jgi:hypothetical protein